MPYRRTGRPNGRPPKYPFDSIAQLEAKAAKLTEQARRHQAVADAKIARLLASGKTRRQVATEINSTIGHVRVAARRHERRKQQEATS